VILLGLAVSNVVLEMWMEARGCLGAGYADSKTCSGLLGSAFV
jgi:hypothetical protein